MRSLIALGLALAFPLLALWQVQRATAGKSGGVRDRAELIILVLAGALFLLFSRAVTEWQSVSPFLWLLALALLVAAVAFSGRAWPKLEWIKSPRPRLRILSVTLQLLLGGAIVAVLV